MPVNIITDRAESQVVSGNQMQAEALVHDCAEKVQKQYPGFVWSVRMSADYSVLALRNYNIDAAYGMIVHTTAVQNDPSRYAIVRAAGELLERAYLARGAQTETDATLLDLSGAHTKRTADKHSTHKTL